MARDVVELKSAQYAEAIRELARALPKPLAVRWACQCIRQAVPELSKERRTALERAEAWAADPSEENRRAAKAAADAVGLDHPAGAVAMAAFMGGGSLAPPDLPPVAPAEQLTARAVAGAVLLAAVFTDPEQAESRYREFLIMGRKLHGWQAGFSDALQ